MDRRTELFSFWQVQENLLQNYRIMAITLLGLISAGILVIVTYILQNRAEIVWSKDVYMLDLLLLLLFSTLLVLGLIGTVRFKKITDDRAAIVTFFQNLLIAEESGRLIDILKKYNLPDDPKSLHLHRVLTQKAKVLPFQYSYEGDVLGFVREMSLNYSELGQSFNRHHVTRKFLSGFIYLVFFVFFMFASITLIVTLFAYFEVFGSGT